MAEDPGRGDIRAALAAQLLQLRPRDLLAQTAVMLANQAALRLGVGNPEQADREQAREAIDALAGVVELLEPLAPAEEMDALRGDLAQLRMAYVQSGAAPARRDHLALRRGTRRRRSGARVAGGRLGRGVSHVVSEPADDDPPEERPPIWTPGGEV